MNVPARWSFLKTFIKRITRGRDWHREAIGGLWDEVGRLQFEFLVKNGLKPPHWLLDIGCGSLRGGVHAIGFLEVGHYYGVDKEPEILEAGRTVELKRYGLEHKRPVLLLADNFDFSAMQHVRFDFMIAQSVFTHLVPGQIEQCLTNAMPLLKPDGTFYATCHVSDEPNPSKPHTSRKNERKRASYPFSTFRDMSDRLHVAVEYVGDWGHPRDQKMLAFRHSSATKTYAAA